MESGPLYEEAALVFWIPATGVPGLTGCEAGAVKTGRWVTRKM
jgi:hypothetical protein